MSVTWGYTCIACGMSASGLSRDAAQRLSDSHRCEPRSMAANDDPTETLDQILSRLITLEMQVRELRKDNSVQERKAE